MAQYTVHLVQHDPFVISATRANATADTLFLSDGAGDNVFIAPMKHVISVTLEGVKS